MGGNYQVIILAMFRMCLFCLLFLMYSGTSGSEAVNSKYLDLAEKDIESILKSSRDELFSGRFI